MKRPIPGQTEMVSHSTSLQALETVREHWGWIKWASRDEGYIVEVPLAELPEPEWNPEATMDDMVRKAFRTRYISDQEHPVYKALTGRT